MNYNSLLTAFSAGELSPLLHGRVDLQKWQYGLARCLNFAVLPQGAAAKRPGTVFIGKLPFAAKRARLIEFALADRKRGAVVAGWDGAKGYLCFVVDDALVLKGGRALVIEGIPCDPWGLDYVQSADVLFITSPAGFFELRHLADDDWRLVKIDVLNMRGPFGQRPAKYDGQLLYLTIDGGKYYLQSKKAALPDPVKDKFFSVGQLVQVDLYAAFSSQNVTLASGEVIYRSKMGGFAFSTRGTWAGDISVYKSPASLNEWELIEVFRSNNDSNFNQSQSFAELSDVRVVVNLTGGSGYYTAEFEPFVCRVSCMAAEYSGVRLRVMLPESYKGVPVGLEFAGAFRPGAFAGKFPEAVGFYQNRLAFGMEQEAFMSQPDDYWNLSTEVPSVSSDALQQMLLSRRRCTIKHLVPMVDLVVLTSDAEFSIGGNQRAGAIAPGEMHADVEGYRGCSDCKPVIAGNRILFVQQANSNVFDLGYDFQSDGYIGGNISILAQHLFEGFNIIQMAYQQEPYSLVWAVRSDGHLLGLTYLKDQDLWAWHEHVTDGFVLSAAAVSGVSEDVLYLLVERECGVCIERLAKWDALSPDFLSVFADCASVVDSELPVCSVYAPQLANRDVAVCADGSVFFKKADKDGRIDLEVPAHKVVAGLGYVSLLRPLPLMESQSSASRHKRLNRVFINVFKSLGGRVDGYEIKVPAPKRYGDAAELVTGLLDVTPQGSFERLVSFDFVHDVPLPCTVLALIPWMDGAKE